MRLAPRVLLPALCVLSAPLIACQSQQTGDQGLLRFSYVTDDNPGNFNKPIAVGARLDVRIEEAGGLFAGLRADPDITAATAEDESIIRGVEYSGNVATFEGVAPGSTKLQVTATLNSAANRGKSVEDTVTFRAAAIDHVDLFHTCTLERTAHYLTNTQGDLWLTYELYGRNGLDNREPIIGYGVYPYTVEPEGALTVDEGRKDQQWFHFTGYPETATTVTLTGAVGDSQLTMEFVEPGAVQATRLVKFTDGCVGDGERDMCAFAGNEFGTRFYVQPLLDGDTPVCQSDLAFEVETLTPEVCDVRPVGNPNADAEETTSSGEGEGGEAEPVTIGANERNWVVVVGKVIGDCQFAVSYPEGNGGMGARTELSVTIKGGPGDVAE